MLGEIYESEQEVKAENKSLKEELGCIVKKSIELGLEIPDDVMESVKKYKLIFNLPPNCHLEQNKKATKPLFITNWETFVSLQGAAILQ